MSAAIGPRIGSEALEGQIMRAELQFQHRRRRISTSAAKLEQSIRRQLTSPAALLLAGGLGFVVGDLVVCNATTLNRAADSRVPGNHFFARALSIIAVARSLRTAIHTMRGSRDP